MVLLLTNDNEYKLILNEDKECIGGMNLSTGER